MAFSAQETERYARHFTLAGFGPEAQEKLKASHVLVIGAGGLGCPALLYLAAAGVGHLTVMDGDRVDRSNLQRQVLFTEADVGLLKVDAAAGRLRALNPHITIIPVAERFHRGNALARLQGIDVVVDGSDNFATRYLVNDACVLADKPFVYGAIHRFDGQASVFNWRGGPTYRCLFPEPPQADAIPNCAEAGVLGVLPGLIGTVQATEAIKLLTGIGETLSGRLLLWDALSMTSSTFRIPVDPQSRQISDLPAEGYGEVSCALLTPEHAATPQDITVSDLKAQLAHTQLIDVRETHERALGAIHPSVHIALRQLRDGSAKVALAKLDAHLPTVVYCAQGARSLQALQLLRQHHGFTEARSLRGGFEGWRRG